MGEKNHINLNGTWKLYYYQNDDMKINAPQELSIHNITCIPCTVPGNVELDLSAAGVLPKDIFRADNILKAEKFESYDWWYETEFSPVAPSEGQKVFLKFGGVDCNADYFLNHKKIGKSNNMFIEHEFDVTDILNYGEKNILHVHIISPLAVSADADYDLDMISYSWHNYPLAQSIRKAAHSFGWDIMPRALSAGVWRNVELYYRDSVYFKFLHFELKDVNNNCGKAVMYYQAHFGVKEAFKSHLAIVSGICGTHTFKQECEFQSDGGYCYINIPNIKLWWPKNYGEPNIYDITVEVFNNDGNVLLTKQLRQGFRTLKLNRSDIVTDSGKFEFVINGTKIMAVGANWVPMDVYHSRDLKRYKKALELANDIGCNILRCWGGNVYEDREFFEYCDAHGIMVWQDFAMACLYYPQTDEFSGQIAREVESVVKKLRNYACLVLWCGDNEVDFMISPKINPSVNRLTREVIPGILRRLDPYRPYIASSPYISDKAWELGNACYPEDHLWGPRDYFKSNFYNLSKACFISEIGYRGLPARESLEKFIDIDQLWPYNGNSQWNLHSTNQQNSTELMDITFKQIKQLFGELPENFDDCITASQISQAEALKFFVERVRSKMSTMGGIIWWNLIDGWPGISGATVDYYYHKKLAYYYLKRCETPVLALMGEMESWGHPILISNSTRNQVDVSVRVVDVESSTELFSANSTVNSNSNSRIGFLPMMYSDKGMLLLEYNVNGKSFKNTYLYGTPPFDYKKYVDWIIKIGLTDGLHIKEE